MSRAAASLALAAAAALAAFPAAAPAQDADVLVPHETPDVRTPAGDAARGIPTPTGLVTREDYRARRQELMRRMGGGVAVIFAADRIGGGSRQNPDFYYLTGLEFEAGAALLLAPEEPHYKEILFLEDVNPETNRWDGQRALLGRAMELGTGIARIRRTGSLPGAISSALLRSKDKEMVFLGPVVGYSSAIPKSLQVGRDATSRIPGASVRLDHLLLTEMRQIKSDKELELMQRAIGATERGLAAAMTAARPGMTEWDVKRIIEGGFRDAGCRNLAFDSIVGSGPNSTVLHYTRDDRIIGEGDLILCDVGAECEMYAADITRTFPVGGAFSARQREVYDVVLRAADEAMAAVRPGVTMHELNLIARGVIEQAGYTDDFPHGLGHFVGLNVHDAGDYDAPLAAGSVITIEPGIYLPDENIGIRIEDDVLVTETGYKVLSDGLPRRADELERFITNLRSGK